MKKLKKIKGLIILINFLIILISCTESNRQITIVSNENPNLNGLNAIDKPIHHQIPGAGNECHGAPKDCFATIIVEAPPLPPLPSLYDLNAELLTYINNNQLSIYFSDTSKYMKLFPNLDGIALSDLVNNVTTLRLLSTTDTISYWKVYYLNDTTISPDYSGFY